MTQVLHAEAQPVPPKHATVPSIKVGYPYVHQTPGPQQSLHLAQQPNRIRYVLEHMESGDYVDRLCGQPCRLQSAAPDIEIRLPVPHIGYHLLGIIKSYH